MHVWLVASKEALQSGDPSLPGLSGRHVLFSWGTADVALSAPAASGDFNGDGTADLAVGVPDEDVTALETKFAAGAVSVLYGTPFGGLSPVGNTFWAQDSIAGSDPDGVFESFDRFGSEVAAGDFNGDRFADLAVGVPSEDIRTEGDAGAVNIFYGSFYGLLHAGTQFWHQNTPGVSGVAERLDNFGSALTAGDFNGDGRADLAVGVEKEDLGTVADAGAVNVFYGTVAGLSVTGSGIWRQAGRTAATLPILKLKTISARP